MCHPVAQSIIPRLHSFSWLEPGPLYIGVIGSYPSEYGSKVTALLPIWLP